jgi:hypothetical protein
MSEDKSPKPGGAPQVYQSIELRPVKAATKPRGRLVFETVRIVDLPRFQRRLKRARPPEKAGAEWAEIAQRLSAAIGDLMRQRPFEGPEVVILRWKGGGGVRPDYAVLGHVIFIGAHLSRSWTEGEESEAALRAMNRAIDEYCRMTNPCYEAGSFGPDPEKQPE